MNFVRNAQAPPGAMPVFIPIYQNPLATLPAGAPIPFSQLLAAHTEFSRQLATVLLVAQTWQHVELGMETLPGAKLSEAINLLALSERDRVLSLLAAHLVTLDSRESCDGVRNLSPGLKRAVWSKLTEHQQDEVKRRLARFPPQQS